MTDSDSINPFEAPRQPTISSELTIDEPIRYEATPTINDLNSALRSLSAIASASILLLILTFTFIGISISIVVDGLDDGKKTIVWLLCLIFTPMVAFHLYLTFHAAKRHLRLNPKATAPLTGELTNEGLLLRSENCIAWQRHESLQSCVFKNNQVCLTYGPVGHAVQVLPQRGFRNSNQAIRFLESQVDKVFEPSIMLEPLVDPSMIGDPPAEAIAFGGVVQFKDIATSPLKAARKRNDRWNLIALSLLFAVLLPAAALMFSWIGLLVVGVAFSFCIFSAVRNIRSFSKSLNTETPLTRVRGLVGRSRDWTA